MNSVKPDSQAQDFQAALSSADVKPTRKAAGHKQGATGAAGGQLPAPGNVSPPAALPAAENVHTMGIASSPEAPVGAQAGTAAVHGAPAQIAAQGSGSAPLDAPAAAPADQAAASPGALFAQALALPVDIGAASVPAGAAVNTGNAPEAAPANTASGVSAARATTATDAAAPAKGAALASNGAVAADAAGKPPASQTDVAAAAAALKFATSAPSSSNGASNAGSNAADPAAAAPASLAASADAMTAATSGTAASGRSEFSLDSNSPSVTADETTAPTTGIAAQTGAIATAAPGRAAPLVSASSLPAAPATARANAQEAHDKPAPGSEGTSHLAGSSGDSAAGAAQINANTTQAPDASAPTLKVSAGVDTPEFAHGLADRVSWMVDNNLNGAKLQVNPPQLGPIEVRIAVQGGHAQVWLASHSAVTRDALESSSSKLREMLGAQGFGQVSVDISQRSFHERPSRAPPYEWTPAADGQSTAAVSSTASSLARTSSGALDAYA